MVSEKSEMKVQATYSQDKSHRYLIKRTWDESKPSALVVMLSPSHTANSVALDMTSMYATNNCYKLGFGSINIMNIYSGLDGKLANSPENDEMLVSTCKEADAIVLAWGKGCTTKQVGTRVEEVQKLLKPFAKKLKEISDGKDAGFHPLAKTVRLNWQLVEAKLPAEKAKA